MRLLFVLSLLCLTLSAPMAAVQDSAALVVLNLSAPEARELADGGKLTIIDIRTPKEWRQTGVADGVLRIDMRHPGGPEGFAAELLHRLGGDRHAPIGLICRTGNRTTQVQSYLLSRGFTKVYNIREGMAGSAAGPGWLRRKLPVSACKEC